MPSDFLKWGIPERYLSARFKDLRLHDGNRKFILAAQRHAYTFRQGQVPPKGFCVLGPKGTGKTHVLCCVAKAAIANKWRVRGWVKPPVLPTEHLIDGGDEIVFWKWPMLLYAIDRSRRLRTGTDPLRETAWSDRIFVDDFTVRVVHGNADSPYNWQQEAAFVLFDILWDRQPGTFSLYITTNNTPDEMADAWGDQSMDRLRAITEAYMITGGSER